MGQSVVRMGLLLRVWPGAGPWPAGPGFPPLWAGTATSAQWDHVPGAGVPSSGGCCPHPPFLLETQPRRGAQVRLDHGAGRVLPRPDLPCVDGETEVVAGGGRGRGAVVPSRSRGRAGTRRGLFLALLHVEPVGDVAAGVETRARGFPNFLPARHSTGRQDPGAGPARTPSRGLASRFLPHRCPGCCRGSDVRAR